MVFAAHFLRVDGDSISSAGAERVGDRLVIEVEAIPIRGLEVGNETARATKGRAVITVFDLERGLAHQHRPGAFFPAAAQGEYYGGWLGKELRAQVLFGSPHELLCAHGELVRRRAPHAD